MDKIKKIKIILIGPTPPPYNGMSVITDTILNSSLNERFEIIHLDIADRRTISNMGKFDFINIYLALIHSIKFLWVLCTEKPDLVYLPIAQNVVGYLRDSLFLIPCRILKKKVLVHLHGSYFKDFYTSSNIFIRKLIDFTLKKISGIIVLGNCLKYIFKEILPEEKIFVVSNGIEDNFNDYTAKYFNKNDVFHILFLSNLCKEKGIFEVLKVIPAIIRKFQNVRFIFAGNWVIEREKKEAMGYIDDNKLQPYIEFIGAVSGKMKKMILSKSNLFVFPTFYPPFEGQPLVILEAMSAGLPVISTNKGAIGETIIDGENGFLVEIGNSNQLIEKVIEIISDSQLYEKMVKRSREIYLEKFTKERFIQNLFDIFNKICRN